MISNNLDFWWWKFRLCFQFGKNIEGKYLLVKLVDLILRLNHMRFLWKEKNQNTYLYLFYYLWGCLCKQHCPLMYLRIPAVWVYPCQKFLDILIPEMMIVKVSVIELGIHRSAVHRVMIVFVLQEAKSGIVVTKETCIQRANGLSTSIGPIYLDFSLKNIEIRLYKYF